jgi:outer membrane protein TolC
VTFTQSNPYAPLLPYFNSVYDNDPELQQFFVDNPDVPDARILAQQTFEPAVIVNQHDYRFTLTLSQTLYNARAFPLLDQAELALASAESGVEVVTYQLEGALLQLYFNAVTFQRVIEAAQRNLDLARLALDRAQVALEEDVGSQFEVTRTQVALSTAERDLENARLAYRLSIEALATLLNTDANFDAEEPPTLTVPTDLDALVAHGLETRPDLRMHELVRSLDEARADEVDAQWWPILTAQASATVARSGAFSGDEFSWQLMVIASWNIWDGGLRSAASDSIEIDQVTHSLAQEQAVADLESDLQQGLLRLDSLQRNAENAQAEAELARENLALTQDALTLGAATRLEVDLAQQQLFLSELAQADAEVQLQAQIYALYRLAGLWE